LSGGGHVARRLREELAQREASLASGGFLVTAVDVVDEGRWGRLDATVDGQSGSGKLQIHLSSKGAVSVVPQGAAAAGIAHALGMKVRAAQSGPASASPAQRAVHSASGGPPDPRAPVIVDCSKFGKHLIGPTEWRGVQPAAGGGFVEVFHSARYARGHNNLGELLAIVDACERIADGRLSCSGIRSDSRTAISWFSKRTIKTTIDVDGACDPEFAAAVRRAAAWLASPARAACKVPLTLWDTKREGENPADFGRK
jgi:ribonuclease HI